MCGVLGLLAPCQRCAGSVLCVACAVSWATWILFTGVLAPWVVLCCVCGVLGHLAPVPRCARSVRCVACAVSWGTWLLFTGVRAPCVVLRVRCPRPLGSCSPVCPLGVLCCVCGVLGHLAPVDQCARLVCCVACAGCRWGAHTPSSGRLLFVASRGWVPSGRARVHLDGGCFVAGRGWVRCRARTRPCRRRLFCSRQRLGSLPGAHTSIWTAAGVAWHLFSCRVSLRVVRALRICGTPWPSLFDTCLCALVMAGGVPRGPAWCATPHAVRFLSVLQSAFPTPWCLSPPLERSVPDLLCGCAGQVETGREPGSWCLPLAPTEAGALGSLRVVPVRGPAVGLSLAGPSGVGLRLRGPPDPAKKNEHTHTRTGLKRGVTRPGRRGVAVHTNQPR